MAKRKKYEEFNDALEKKFANAGFLPPELEFAEMLEITDALRDLPRAEFKTGLNYELKRRASMLAVEKSNLATSHAIIPRLSVKDAAAAIEFYKRALGASEIMRLTEPNGRIGHAELLIGDSMIMLADEYPEYGIVGPQSLGGSGVTIHLYVEDADATVGQAVEAGAQIVFPVSDQFYGDRAGRFKDPFGHTWSIATHKEDVSSGEMQSRLNEMMKDQKPKEPPVHYVPEGLRSITPTLHPKGADKVIAFMKQAFDAEEVTKHLTPQGTIAHSQVRIGDSVIELGEAHGPFQPMPTAFHLYVKDADAVYRKAVDAGATSVSEPVDQFYGDREACVIDPFGNHWYIATHKKDV
jgi:PhnB protein